jgi:hypothetical protein
MELSDLLGFRSFATEQEIKDCVARSASTLKGGENYEQVRALLIFSTSKQHTWLIRTNARLYLVLDDRRKDDPKVQWSVPLAESRDFPINTKPDYTRRSGLVDFGPKHRDWLYTKRLFQEDDITIAIKRFISEAAP